jgi:uncharacterized membrane protein YczE
MESQFVVAICYLLLHLVLVGLGLTFGFHFRVGALERLLLLLDQLFEDRVRLIDVNFEGLHFVV